jgi:hypothetical protein
LRSQEDIEIVISNVRSRVTFLRKRIEQDNALLEKYWNIANILRVIENILSVRPIDTKKLIGETVGITRIFDGPLHNDLEEEAVKLAEDIGIMVMEMEKITKY